MRKDAAVGLIFANMHDEAVRDATSVRAMGSLPFGGRYRLIDFVLSAMVSGGITPVGVITKSNYQSLMDHLGSGKAWDLSRKHNGLYFLPQQGGSEGAYQGRLDALVQALPFLRRTKGEYVILSDCHMVSVPDYTAMLQAHVESGADVTVGCCYGAVPALVDIPVLRLDENKRVTDLLIGRISEDEGYYGTGVYIMRREWLIRTVTEAVARNLHHFERDILQSHLRELKISGYCMPSPVIPIYSMAGYFQANLALLSPQMRAELFPKSRPVYTKLRDCAPARYGLHAQVTDSLVGDGARIDGVVKNCVVFRGVQVDRGAVLENCVIMQDVTVGAGCSLRNIVADKNAVFRQGTALQGSPSYPIYIAKNSIV